MGSGWGTAGSAMVKETVFDAGVGASQFAVADDA